MSSSDPGPRPPWRAILVALALGSAIALVLLHEVASPLRVEGSSMDPTLEDGAVGLVLWSSAARRAASCGSIVVARLPANEESTRVVKRIAAVRGAAPNRLFELAGDNSRLSRDSRAYGDVKEFRVEGVLVARLFPRPTYWGVSGPPAPTLGSRDALSPAGR